MGTPEITPRDAPPAEVIEAIVTAIDDWADSLAHTREDYIDAMTSGEINGRRISKELAKTFAHDFGERSSAVAGCVAIVRETYQKATSGDTRGEATPPLPASSRADVVEWQPMETAPRDGTIFVVERPDWSSSSVSLAFWHEGQNTPCFVHRDYKATPVDLRYYTLWWPLPKPPRALAGDQK